MTRENYTKKVMGFVNQNSISFKNKNPEFSSSIYYCKKTLKYHILLMANQVICGESFKSANYVVNFIKNNINSDGTDDNIVFNYSTEWKDVNKGRLFYTLEQENNIRDLLLLLLI